jgi:hypothetical protein
MRQALVQDQNTTRFRVDAHTIAWWRRRRCNVGRVLVLITPPLALVRIASSSTCWHQVDGTLASSRLDKRAARLSQNQKTAKSVRYLKDVTT